MTSFLLIISFLFSLFLTFLFWKLGERYEIYDVASNDPLKIHKKSVSCLGGLAMILTVSITFFLKMVFEKNFDWQIFGIIIGGILIFLLGFLDDSKWKSRNRIKPRQKFVALIIFSFLAAIILLKSGLKIQLFPSFIIEIILTFLYIFVLINAVNYQDGMDGLAGGVVAISLIGFIVLGAISGNSLTLIISLILLGAVLGFLIFNFPPAKIFMGDSGAYFLGFILAVMAMIFSKPFNFPSIFSPIFIIGLPLFDGVFTNIRRLCQKKSIFLGDRKHFYDRLYLKNFSVRKTILICYFIQVIFIVIGLLIFNL